jgi:hypothetical protein
MECCPDCRGRAPEFFYVNPLQVRTHRTYVPAGHEHRAPWQFCACCPPNLMRMLSSWQQYLATADETGVQLHQYATSTISSSGFELAVQTSYPWDGRVTVDIVSAPERTWTLALRVPQWCTSAVVAVGDADPVPAAPGVFSETRAWRAGDRVVLDLDLAVRQVDPDPRVDAVRGCVAFERGPIVYCVESVDLPGDPGAGGPLLGPVPPAGDDAPARPGGQRHRPVRAGRGRAARCRRSLTTPGRTGAWAGCGSGSRGSSARPARDHGAPPARASGAR